VNKPQVKHAWRKDTSNRSGRNDDQGLIFREFLKQILEELMTLIKSKRYKCQHIKGHRLKTILAAANCIIPEHAGLSKGGTLDTAGVVDWAIDQMPKELRFQFLLFISVVYVMGFFFGGRPFHKLLYDDQIRELKWMESSPINAFRMGFMGLKSYICMGYFTREQNWTSIHYCGPIVYDQPSPDPVIRQLCQGKIKVQS